MAVDNEEEYLKAVLANNDVLSDTIDIVKSRDFRATQNRIIYDTILDGWEKGYTIDPPVLVAELERTGRMEAAGGTSKVLDLSFGNPSQADYFAKKIRDRAELWRLELFATELKQRASGTDEKPGSLLEWADESLANVTDESTGTVTGMADAVGEMVDYLNSVNDVPSLATGFTDLDKMLNGGFRGGQMIIVAARPGQGKSVASADFIRNASINLGKPTLMFSLEMSRPELMARITAAESSTPLSKLLSGSMTDEDWKRIAPDLDRIENAPIFIDDSPGLTINDIRSKTRQMVKSHGVEMVVIDYLGLIKSTGSFKDRQLEVSEYSRSCKLLAKECDIPIVVVAQLNREVEKRGDDAVPKLSDLRESGSLEMDCDVCIMIHRPDGKNPDHARAGEVDFLIQKNRAGRMGTITLPHQLHMSRFMNWSQN